MAKNIIIDPVEVIEYSVDEIKRNCLKECPYEIRYGIMVGSSACQDCISNIYTFSPSLCNVGKVGCIEKFMVSKKAKI